MALILLLLVKMFLKIIFLNCIKDNEIYKSDEFEISSRNNLNKSKEHTCFIV